MGCGYWGELQGMCQGGIRVLSIDITKYCNLRTDYYYVVLVYYYGHEEKEKI
jgi:hypothetical protein